MSVPASSPHRQSTGVPGLDQRLGGGLLPGTLTVVAGATGIGKTQLGLQFARAGLTAPDEQRGGVIFDVSARGDSQSHQDYARRMFDYRGSRVTRRDLDHDQWHRWQAELNARLGSAIAFLYGNFVQGVRRVVFDGIEPADRPQESIQWNLLEYVYHQIVRKDPEWVARDLFRQHYRPQARAAAQHSYDPQQIGCLMLSTSHDTMLDELISRPLDEGDSLTNANLRAASGRRRVLRPAHVAASLRDAHPASEMPDHV
ncbi:MAG: recombinase RecA [Planctomycetaceae bacterium]|nr:MAG: recombinase RecA [Planctomycetaceae bacterium]